MSADKLNIFVAHNELLSQLTIPSDNEVRQNLQGWSVQQLRTWLGLRGVRSGDALKEDLVRIAYFTWKLNLAVNQDEVTTQKEASARLEEILTIDNNLLPDPASISDWVTDLRQLPTITYGNIYNYLINSPGIGAEKLKAYKSLDAYNYAVNGWVHEIQISRPVTNIAFVRAKVKPSQHSTAPYDAWVMVGDDGRIEGGRCCCTAGLGEVCSHVGALLFKMMGAAELGLNEPDSCTSKASEWNKAFCKHVQPEELHLIDFRKPRLNEQRKLARPVRKPSRVTSTCSSDGELWEIIAEAAPNAVALHILSPPSCPSNPYTIDDVFSEVTVTDSDPVVSLPADIPDIVEQCSTTVDAFKEVRTSVSPEQSELIANATTEQSSNRLWSQLRENRITASKMGDVVSFMHSKRSSPSASLLNSIKGPERSLEKVPAVQWGRWKEDDAKQDYLHEMRAHKDIKIKSCGLNIPAGDGHLGASPDGLITCSCCPDRVLEVKCPYTAACQGLCPSEGALTGVIPFLDHNKCLKTNHKYYTQVQAQMAILGVQLCDFVVWTPEGIILLQIQFNLAYWTSAKGAVDRFYTNYFLPSLRPMLSSSTNTFLPVPPIITQKRRPTTTSDAPRKKRRNANN